MAYTRPWTVATPSKHRSIDQLDDAIRELRVDFAERINTLVGSLGSMSNDPIVPASNSFYELVHWSAFKFAFADTAQLANCYEPTGLSAQFGVRMAASSNRTFYAPIILPRPCTLVDVSVFCHTVASTTITATVYKHDANTSTVSRSSLATRTITGVNGQARYSVSSGANINSSMALGDKTFYTIELVNNNAVAGVSAYGFQGVLIQYTKGALACV